MNNESLFKKGKILKVKGVSIDHFFGLPTNLKMVDGFDLEKACEVSEKWLTYLGFMRTLANLDEYKNDMVGLLPENIIELISDDVIFYPSRTGTVYVWLLKEIEITKVIHDTKYDSEADGKNHYLYDFSVDGISVCDIQESALLRHIK